MPRIIYTALLYLLSPLYFVRLLIRGIKDKDYLKRWPERLGFCNVSPLDKPILWIHAVSVGEVNASLPLIRVLLNSFPQFASLHFLAFAQLWVVQ